jgi:pilus assembly protein CpaF
MSFDVILPFLRPIAHLIEDPDVSEIMVNGSRRVFVERQGLVQEITDVRVDERNLRVAVKNIARALGDDVSEAQPILDSRLPDGSRVAAVFPPCSVGGTTLTIRKFQTRFFTADELVRIGTLSGALQNAIERGDRGAMKRNVVLTEQFLSVMRRDLAATQNERSEDRAELREDRRETRTDRR